MELSVLRSLNQLLVHNHGIEAPVFAYEQAAVYLFLGVLLAIAALARGVAGESWRRTAVAAGLSAALALAIGKVISTVVDRPRPYVVHPHLVHLFAPHAADPGFPSDHATASFAIACAILLRHRGWGVFALVAAAVLSVGRVALGYHYPSDVVAGAILGCLAAVILWLPPARGWVDRISDFAGAIWDWIVDRLMRRPRSGARPPAA